MDIRITGTPPGEAPERVRAAWVGIVLPLAIPEACKVETVGVLSRPRSNLGLRLARLLGRTRKERGYVVKADRAIEVLAAHAPDAARWWRETAARSIEPGQYFMFAEEVCEEVAA